VTKAGGFEPNWAVPPGATISTILADRALSKERFALALGESIDKIQRLILGLVTIDAHLARRLSHVIGSTPNFWLTREKQYRDDVERLHNRDLAVANEAWVKILPFREMVSLGWIGQTDTVSAAVSECLRFFGVQDIASWHNRYGSRASVAAFRMALSQPSKAVTVAAWLRWAELVADRIDCAPWSPQMLHESLSEIRRLTWQKRPASFLPALRQICSRAGVAVVVARTPKGCPASGATFFTNSAKAVIVLSFRYRADDQFWFTLFHEMGHLVLHGPKATFLEDGSDATPEEEAEANKFAESIIVPDVLKDELLAIHPTVDSVLRFSRKVGIAPGLIVGQLQYRGVIPPDMMNRLKRRYAWDQIDADRLIP